MFTEEIMGAEFASVPQPYGAVHIGIVVFIAAAALGLFFLFKRLDDKKLLRIIIILGAFMLLTEIWKQFFVAKYVYKDVVSAWFFPWQLCSMAMYCSFSLLFIKGAAREAVLVFLCTFTPLAAVMALAVPEDMMRPQIALFCHSFLFHALMIVECLAAMRILRRRERVRFYPSVILFLIMAAAAEAINVISHNIIRDIHVEANMFYITPYYPSTQPVFHEIAVRFGTAAEIIVYLLAIILASFGIFLIEFRLGRRRKSAN